MLVSKGILLSLFSATLDTTVLSRYNFRQFIRNAKILFVNIILMLNTVKIHHDLFMLSNGNNLISHRKEDMIFLLNVLA